MGNAAAAAAANDSEVAAASAHTNTCTQRGGYVSTSIELDVEKRFSVPRDRFCRRIKMNSTILNFAANLHDQTWAGYRIGIRNQPSR